MALLDYMTYDDVRAALGVSTDEIKDATLSLDIYSSGLTQELEDISVNLSADYLVIKEIDLDLRTTIQTRLYQATRLYATYSVAKQLGTSLPMFGPKDITDGKATVSRFAGTPYQDTIDAVGRFYDGVRKRLVDVYRTFSSDTTSDTYMPLFGIASPDTDPVVE